MSSSASPASRLAELSESYLTALFETHPTMAAGLGLHEYDGRLPRQDEPARARRGTQLRGLRARLGAIPYGALDVEDAHDHTLLAHAIDEELFELEELREFERNPLAFSGPLDVSGYIKRDYAPVERRVGAMTEHLRQVPEYLSTARDTLCRPVPRPFLDTALEVFGGTVQFHETDLRQAVRAVPGVATRERFEEANDRAIDALRRFMRYLEEEARPKATEDFPLGEERFLAMLRLGEMVDLPIARLLEIGEADLARNEARLRDACRRIAPGRPVREVLADQARLHPPADRLLAEAEAVLDDLWTFVEARGLVSMQAAVRCRVEATPPFARWAFAMMDTAGPFETSAESFYYVTLPDPAWTPEQTEEWLRKFDYATLRDVGIHEVYPGHYAHFLHMRTVSRSLRRVLNSYSFVEGWAHYCEEMMLDAGYAEGDPHLRVAQLSEALLRNVRFLVSIRMHTRGLSQEAAARMFAETAHMEPLPADREAARGTFDPGYLNYTLGKLMVMKLRRDLERHEGGAFSVRGFHDRLMALGAPPLPLARRRFLEHDPDPL